jgi:2-polyprenyl-6-hydroxyphenyl methylase/3-demethylubiquinone-9 3-methyltransferase
VPQAPVGLNWRPARGFVIGSDVSVNYFMAATRP